MTTVVNIIAEEHPYRSASKVTGRIPSMNRTVDPPGFTSGLTSANKPRTGRPTAMLNRRARAPDRRKEYRDAPISAMP